MPPTRPGHRWAPELRRQNRIHYPSRGVMTRQHVDYGSRTCEQDLDRSVPERLIAHEDGTDYRFLCAAFLAHMDCTPSRDEEQMNVKTLGAFAAVALMAACSSTPPAPQPTPTPAAAGIVPGSQEDLVANVGDRVFYDFNSSKLRADGKATLDKQVAWLAKYGSVNVQVAGNCDERGTEEYNLALGERRAHSAANYLK